MRKMSKYSDEFKADAVKLAKETSLAKAGAALGVPEGTLYAWVTKDRETSSTGLTGVKSNISKTDTTYDELLKKFLQQEKELRYMHEINKVLKKSLGIMSADNLDILKK